MTDKTVADLNQGEREVTLSNDRHLVALESTWEIDALCKQLMDVVTPNDNMEHLVVRGISARIQDLSRIVMCALGDEVEETDDLAKRLRRAA